MSLSNYFKNPTRQQNVNHFALIAKMALVDGEMNAEELKMLNKFAFKFNIDTDQYDEILKKLDTYPLPGVVSGQERLEYLYELFNIIYVDHVIDEEEMQLIRKCAIGLGFSESQAEEHINIGIKIFGNRISFEEYLVVVDALKKNS